MRDIGLRRIETARLILRKLEMRDVPRFYEGLGGSEAVTKYMLWVPHRDISESEASVRKAIAGYEAGGYYRWAIARKDDDGLVGIIDLLKFREDTNSCSFAYMLAEEFWGQGYGTEALRAVMDFAFSQLELGAVEADHFEENGASGAVMRKAGMRFQGIEERKYEKNGRVFNACLYRLTAQEWRENGLGKL